MKTFAILRSKPNVTIAVSHFKKQNVAETRKGVIIYLKKRTANTCTVCSGHGHLLYALTLVIHKSHSCNPAYHKSWPFAQSQVNTLLYDVSDASSIDDLADTFDDQQVKEKWS